MDVISSLVARYGKQRYLAASLGVYLLADALLPNSPWLTFLVLALMMITGPMAVASRTRHSVFMALLAIGMVVLGVYGYRQEIPNLANLALCLGVGFFGGLIYLISKKVMIESKGVTGETLWAAVNVYLLIGLLFAFLYMLTESLVPGSFKGGFSADQPGQLFVYYSFVTMTTLGYGDVTPDTQMAATLAYVQALIGQLYVAILIARLVSMYAVTKEE